MGEINVAFVGDVHGSIIMMYDHLLQLERQQDIVIDAVVQVGDFGIYLPSKEELTKKPIQLAKFQVRTNFPKLWDGTYTVPIPTWVCPGNHEDWKVIEQVLANPERLQNFHILLDGAITDVLGLKVAAIWGNYSPKSYQNPSIVDEVRKLPAHSGKALHIYRPSVEKLVQAGGFDVLITHDAPKGLLPPLERKGVKKNLKRILGLDQEESDAGGCPGFHDIYKSGRPESHFFGHFHVNKVVRRDNPRVVCLHDFNLNTPASIEIWRYTISEGDDEQTKSSNGASAANA